MAETEYGYQPGQAYAPAYEAALRRLRGGFARSREQLAQATSNIRTSGVSQIPQETLGRGQSEAEAGLIGQFAGQQAEQGILDRRRQEDFERQKQLAELGYNAQDAIQRRLAGKQLEGQLIGGAVGGLGSYLYGGA